MFGWWAARVGLLIGPAGCAGNQSMFSPAGVDALATLNLFWVMLAGAVVIWFALNGLFLYVTRIHVGKMSRRLAEAVIIGGGILFPLVVLSALLIYSLPMMGEQRAPDDGLRVRVTAERWWWRVEYWPDGATAPIIAANELRLPVDQRTEIELTAGEVIHSFWIPALGGKTDMFPGRITRMTLAPSETGTFRGQCAEFCGLSHALMAIPAVIMEPAAFDGWLREQALPATSSGAGRAVFLREGCGACHAVRGTPAAGRVGPDLTHLGGRTALAAGILPMTADALRAWITNPEAIKPGAEMPAYDHLDESDLAALAAYLMGLK
nr:c-type cytochrome [Paracoccus beibuensis]